MYRAGNLTLREPIMKKTVKAFCQYSNVDSNLIKAIIRQSGGWNDFQEKALDITNHGIAGGFSGWIYYTETSEFYAKNQQLIVDMVESQADDYGYQSAQELVKGFRGIDETMSEIEYSFEDIDTDNTLYLKTSSLQFKCYDANVLIDFFECYNANKYYKWKLNYYEGDTLIYAGYVYKDGVTVESLEDKILSIIVLGSEKEFNDFYNNVQLGSSADFLAHPGIVTNPLPSLQGLRFYHARSFFPQLFPNVIFKTVAWLNHYFISEIPYTYSPNTNFHDYGDVMHVKTGYDCFYLDGISKMTLFNSMLSGYGWIWFWYLNELVIQERAATDYDVLEIDCAELEVSQSLIHRYNQFQVDNVIIDNGEYFDLGLDRTSTTSCFCIFDNARPVNASSHNLSGSSNMVYSSNTNYSNRVRPFRNMVLSGTNYLMDFRAHNLSRYLSSDDYNIVDEKTTLSGSGNSLDFTTVTNNYNAKKSLTIKPYINSRNNSAGFDRNNARADDGAYYCNGNFYYAANQPLTASHGLYNGSPSNAIIYYDESIDKYVNYEMYAQTDKFRKNFKKFLKTNDEIIIQIEVGQLITNPLQTVHLSNYQDANLNDKYFSIIKLSFHPIDKISTLTLQMIQ